ncbi:MAG: dual specificity protein phosphatase family protein [Gammaproteobacteria bacterium]|jgi:hypothetical protein|nr:dual specificity protein phosphatase family protein [Gammaproteobacteria bacterium]
MDSHLLTAELVVGACPRSPADINWLRGRGIRAVLCLQTDSDFHRLGIDWPELETAYAGNGLVVERAPITDFDATELRARLPAAASRLDALVKHHDRVYVHCTQGIERAPTVCVAYLAWHRGQPLRDAWTLVRAARNCAPNFEALWLCDRQRRKEEP